MRHRHSLPSKSNEFRKHISRDKGDNLGDGKRVKRTSKCSVFSRLAKIFFGFSHADVGPYPDGPPDMPVFVPILTTMSVAIRLMVRPPPKKEKKDN
jgi:hypothetical protein